MIKSQKYLSTDLFCSRIKRQKSPPKKFASPHQFLHINGQETKLSFFLAQCFTFFDFARMFGCVSLWLIPLTGASRLSCYSVRAMQAYTL